MPIWVHMWGSEDKLRQSVLSFQHIGPGYQTPVIMFDSKYLYPLNHLTWADSKRALRVSAPTVFLLLRLLTLHRPSW